MATLKGICQFWPVFNWLYVRELPGMYKFSEALAKLKKPLLPEEIMKSKKKLNLGSGNNPLPGYVNVDILPERKPDIISLVDKLEFSGDNEWDLVRASHILEHFEYDQGQTVLAEWRRVLKPGGYLVVCCPDYLRLCWLAIFRPYVYDPLSPKWGKDARTLIGGLYALDLPHEFRHKVIFSQRSLTQNLNANGFKVVGRQTYQVEEPYILDIKDDSTTPFSMNIVAQKV